MRFPQRGDSHRGQFIPRGGERGARGVQNWNKGQNESVPTRPFGRGGFFRGDSANNRGFRGRGNVNFAAFPQSQRFAPPPIGNNDAHKAFVPTFSQALDMPADGRGFRKFGRPDTEEKSTSSKIPETNLGIIAMATKERRSRFSDLPSDSLSEAPPGTESTFMHSGALLSNIPQIQNEPRISPSFEQRLNATFFINSIENAGNETIGSFPSSNYSDRRTPIVKNLPLSIADSSLTHNLGHKS